MDVIDHIPVELHLEELVQSLKMKNLREKEISALMEDCQQLITPKAVYTFLKVSNIKNDEVSLEGGYALKSVILADMLKDEQIVAPYVVTIGSRLEEKASEEAKNSMFRAWVMERIGNYAVSKASVYVKKIITERLGGQLSTFAPGTGTGALFGIDQQENLFRILNPATNIGVKLTPSHLMLPRKSVSGVYAAAPQEYVACQYCPRERCENRRKSFSGEYFSVNCKHRD